MYPLFCVFRDIVMRFVSVFECGEFRNRRRTASAAQPTDMRRESRPVDFVYPKEIRENSALKWGFKVAHRQSSCYNKIVDVPFLGLNLCYN